MSTAVGRSTLSDVTDALDAISHPAIALDSFGTVIEASADVEAMFGEGICIRNKRLVTSDPLAQAALDELGRRLMTSTDVVALGDFKPIVIRRLAGPPVVVRVMPVPAVARGPFVGARVILTFHAIAPRTCPDVAILAEAFGLTPAEARLASTLATGKSLAAAADEFGVKPETARNQLKTVFAKTGTHRQSELVALLARL